MTDKNKTILKHVLIVLTIGAVAFVVWEIIKAISAGEKTIAGILKAPFTAVSSIWTGITNLFSSSPAVAVPQPAPILNAAGQTVGTVQPTSPLYATFAPPDQAATAATASLLLNGATPSSQSFQDYLNSLLAPGTT